MVYNNYTYSPELYHHGIKGMRWGVRRFETKGGRLTSAGKKRYADSSSGSNPNKGSKSSSSSTTKSNHRQKLEAKYQKQGMSAKQAAMAADRRIKTEKVLAVTAGLTLAAAGAYVAKNQIRDRTDHIIKSGTKLQVIGTNPNKNFDKAFYAAYNKGDKQRYGGLLAKQQSAGGLLRRDVHKTTLDVTKDVKVASKKKSAEVFSDLYKNDPEFRRVFKESTKQFEGAGVAKRDSMVKKAMKNIDHMTDKQLMKEGYDAFNLGLVDHSPERNAINKKFYDKLKEQGYHGIMDINDQKYSGYKSKAPVILFDKADRINVSNVKKMTDKEIDKNLNKTLIRNGLPGMALTGGMYGAGIGASVRSGNTAAINNYRKQHPNTNMSDKEILRTLQRNGGQ